MIEDLSIDCTVRGAEQHLAAEFGESMAAYVTGRLLTSLLDAVTGAEAARLEREHAVTFYLHRCRAACEYLRESAQPAGEGLN